MSSGGEEQFVGTQLVSPPSRRVTSRGPLHAISVNGMARPVSKPPSKLSGVRLSVDLLEACDRAIAQRGLTKREFFERALRKELGLPEPINEIQDQLDLGTDVARKECA